ncbi:Geranylgeranyl pyrophosphate synthase [Schistosoma japonicum]|uniref:Clone ZZD1068 mRNA sequence n=1 Tax=Schistosoma japonicum TaxID=6182 RepID=Q86F69_SCHJA|nr:similar to NM_010282 geranylgeranyl diphosphate synthase 1; GGPP synthase in Mus musculus [Schistosoma japonicum]TNN19353.1 Geranylgeranyl pyrophosphate synthase [Schistosoma japonicum]
MEKRNMDGFGKLSEKVVMEPYNYTCSTNGKGIRSLLMAAFNYWLKVPESTLDVISSVIQMLHNASLIIDDIEDGSYLRRGKPAAHCVFGTASSINSANYVYFLALEKLSVLRRPESVKIFTEQMLELHRGQGMDIYWRSSFKCPSESEYEAMVLCKTGGLFGLGVRLMQLFSKNQTDYKPLLDTIGLFFQIRDDYANLVDLSYHKKKMFAEDLTEGKFSYPIVRAINDFPDDSQVMNILSQHTTNSSLKLHCVQHMLELGALEKTVLKLAKLEERCNQLIVEFGNNPLLSEVMHKLSDLHRTSDGHLRFITPNDLNYPSEYNEIPITNGHVNLPS